ncbi:MAG TPA: nucleotide exchange factor GrpE [Mycobacteriales bacterium]|nr:nucleotide exchange factor GrpE [Mycobacteriales bacterium]
MSERDEHDAEEPSRVVIRDKRRFDPETGEPRQPSEPRHAATDDAEDAEYIDEAPEPGVLFEPRRKPAPSPGAAALQRKLAELTTELKQAKTEHERELAELTTDLKRDRAEYANYRKRVERDRAAAAEAGTGAVLAGLLPVLDNLDRAREHGDLTGAFKAVADQIVDTLGRLGLDAFGAKGDPFDPMIHEAVAHLTSTEVSEPTCVEVMRVGYRHADRLLRPALVAVADPEAPAGGTAGGGTTGSHTGSEAGKSGNGGSPAAPGEDTGEGSVR